MVALDEDALICDLAETYHIYNYRSLPASRVATFAVGLRENSRIKTRLAGMSCPLETLLLAAAVDSLHLLWWAKTRDGAKGHNAPPSILDSLTGRAEKNTDISVFASGEAFEQKRKEILTKAERGE